MKSELALLGKRKGSLCVLYYKMLFVLDKATRLVPCLLLWGEQLLLLGYQQERKAKPLQY